VHPLIESHRTAIIELCHAFGVARLEVFGSVMTDAFDPARSDIDFLVAYPPDYDYGPWLGRFQDLEAALAAELGRPVNLVMMSALGNDGFAREAGKTRRVIFDAANLSHAA
jgi:predicted nucleotidyltransferase